MRLVAKRRTTSLKLFISLTIIDMNYYAKLYSDDVYVHISVIEGIYYSHLKQKARVVGDVNITENKFCKYVKQPYDVINMDENSITLKKSGEETYTLLQNLLISEDYTSEHIDRITSAINTISNNRAIRTNQSCLGNWITF